MRLFCSKRIVVKNFRRRVAGLVCVLLGVTAVLFYQAGDRDVRTRILVDLYREPEGIELDRKMSQYDEGGVVEHCFREEDYPEQLENAGIEVVGRRVFSRWTRECIVENERARQFIWEHWQSKRNGYIQLNFYCPDCETVDHVFIEPDEHGDWRITIRRFLGYQPDGIHIRASESQAYNLKSRLATAEDKPFRPASEILIFVDQFGNEIGSL